MKYLFVVLTFFLFSCTAQDDGPVDGSETADLFLRGVDLSDLPTLRSSNTIFYKTENVVEDMLYTLKDKGVNVVRLKLWHTPASEQASMSEVRAFAKEIKRMGLKLWLTVHYSDSWADPAQQAVPALWEGVSYDSLKDSVYAYTSGIVNEIDPDYIQIGNEINSGILFPHGRIETNFTHFKSLLSEGVQAVRDNSYDTKIMLHFAGFQGSDWFFNEMDNLDFDIIALSYYPLWHGKDLVALSDKISSLGYTFKKPVVIAETAYPFTLEWDDWTTNIVGAESQIILPDYPASPIGQKDFVMKIRDIMTSDENGIGFCYWGGELVAYRGSQAKDGSVWENQALYDFNQIALPVMDVFRE